MKEGNKLGIVLAFAIGVILAILSTWVWTPPWIEPPPPPPGVGPVITHTTYERSTGGVTMTDANNSVHPYTYASDADATSAYLVASQPAASWTNNTVTFTLVTETTVANPLMASNLQLFSIVKTNQKYNVVFEPFQSAVPGDEVSYTFDNTRYADAKSLAMALKHSEGAPGRLALTQAANSTTLTVTFSLQ